MKSTRFWCFALAVLIAIPALAQRKPQTLSPSSWGYAIQHDVSLPLRDLAKLAKVGPKQPPREIPIKERQRTGPAVPSPLSMDPLLHPFTGGTPMPPPILTIEGGSDDEVQTVIGTRYVPPDTNGDVGGNYYVQYINTIINMWNKTTGVRVLGPVAGNTPWIGFGGVCETTDDGDPIAIYDQFTGRWLLSQFAIASGVQCMAVSTSGDPTGTYNRYAFDVSGGENDYPKISVWSDGYYMTFREFNPGFLGSRVVSFDKNAMIQGNPAVFIEFVGSLSGLGEVYDGVQPAHIEGLVPPPVGAPALFIHAFDDEGTGNCSAPCVPNPNNDWYKIWQFHSDFVVPGNSTLTGPVSVPAPDFNEKLCNYSGTCMQQPPPGEGLNDLAYFTMYRLVYRNFGDHDALYVVHTTNVGNDHAGLRYAEIRNPEGAPILFDTGTHSPDTAVQRWMPSISVDHMGDIALGFTASGPNQAPAVRYVGRLVSDPPGSLPQTEADIQPGVGVQSGSFNRWGDYSSMSIDETDDCTFWFTSEYYQTSGSFDFNTKIGSFKFPGCSTGPVGTLSGTVVNANGGAPIQGASVVIGGTYSTITNAAGQYTINLPVGTYDVTASKFGYASQTVNGVVITQDTTTTQDFALQGVAAIMVDGFVTDGSGAGFPLYADVEVVSGGGTTELYTDPATGYYSFQALVGTPYTINVTAEIAGYNTGTASFTTGNTDEQHNFPLTVNQASCNAPGYTVKSIGTPITTDFSAGIPASFGVVSTVTNCSNATFAPGWVAVSSMPEGGNLTGGSGQFAVANSDACGPSVLMDTQLISPAMDLSAFQGGVRVQFNSDYFDLCSGLPVTFDYSANNGASWTTLFNFCGTSRRGPRVETFVTAAADGSPNARFRWHYAGHWDWWWEIDNVSISMSACTFDGGGLVYGNVTDLNNGNAINGASVSLETGQTTQTEATPDDPNVGDGFYEIYAPKNAPAAPGVRVMTVAKTNYGTIVRNVIPVLNGVRNENFALPAGLLSAAPSALRKRLPIGGSDTGTLTLTNSGTLDANYNLLELNVAPPVVRPAGPFNVPDIPFKTNSKLDVLGRRATTARNVPHGAIRMAPHWPNAGEYVGSWSASQLELPWGAGFDFTGTKVWLSSPGVFFGGSNRDWQFTPDGTYTGLQFNTDAAGGSWAGDMAYVGLTNTVWQVNVGGDDCIFEFNAADGTLTGGKICPAFGTSMRGLAYDSGSSHFYAGTWNGNFITEFTNSGSIVRTVNVGLPVSGLAYNPTTNHLFVQVNAGPATGGQQIYVMDANTPGLNVLGSFIIQNAGGGNAFPDFSGAGLELDCAGNLIAVNQTDKNVYIAASGEGGACSVDIPWLSENPTSGTVAQGGGTSDSIATFTAVGQNPGCREAQLLATNNTPYGILNVTVAETVAFNDVAAGAFADRFIHAIAGRGISYGCGAGNFCPSDLMTRRVMPVWLLRGKFGQFYQPPPAVGIFADVSPESFAADWIEDFYNRGITGGCGTNPLRYCPDDPVTRGQMAVFLLVTKEGPGYQPPACTGIFGDMACPGGFTAWAEELYHRGVTGGCSSNPLLYCPNSSTTRAQMSVFESVNFGFPQCGQ